MYKFVLFFINLNVSILLGAYEIGDTMSEEDQNIEYDICYGDYPEEVFKFADINGTINGGDYKIAIIGLSATWWPNCVSSSFDILHEQFAEENRIVFLENLCDLNQPYTCEQWGNLGDDNFPLIFTDPSPYYFHDLWDGLEGVFNNAIILDHNLVFVGAPIASSSSEIAIIIQSLLNEIPSGSNGDINGDGIANILDIISIVNIILDSSYTTTADINYDNIVNILDIIELVNIILSN